jgi:aminopeptidase N
MSTYIVAFVVSNYESIKQNSSIYGFEVEVAAKPESIRNGEGEFALQEATQLIDFFSQHFDIKYALNKSSKIIL